ncbi:hypothetical protein ET495_16575 [Xylanimonas allomyrinae]|uniref:Uncharacterized protein n=1 Tax=Xylanimonas allomyrinae TaxID=2509459 RepID=A0A4P6EP80_9MICO|nr:hypothetical protein [Xylanimonas allomyrinae]QAY64552.1 hypothetical protein ET495_16575 [Xylanimonas allomyrinae]
MEDLRLRHGALRARIGELRLRIALARLHDEQLGGFVRELAADHAADRSPLYVQELALALEGTTVAAADEVASTTEGLQTMSRDIGEVEREMRSFQRQLATWRLLIPRYGLSQRLDPFTEPIDAQLAFGLDQIGALRALAGQCVAASRPFDVAPMAAAVQAVRSARGSVGEFAGQDLSSVPWLASAGG